MLVKPTRFRNSIRRYTPTATTAYGQLCLGNRCIGNLLLVNQWHPVTTRAAMASYAVLGLLLLSSLVAHISAEECYLPDGSSLGGGLRVCDPSAPASACCASGDECTTNGFCKAGNDGDNNWLWRGGCTDKTWESDSCPKYCWDSSTSMATHCCQLTNIFR